MQVKTVESNADIRKCYSIILEMGKRRATLSSDEFLAQVKRQKENDNFIFAYVDSNNEAIAVLGFRYLEYLAFGKVLQLDDLVVSEAKRSSGVGSFVMDWLESQARKNKCENIILGSGTERKRAHKFYFEKNFTIDDYHFTKKL